MSDLQTESWDESSDLFENLVVKNTNNEASLASHYGYNSQRWRIYKGSATESNRLFPEYNTVSEYNHTGDVHELIPAGGETIIMQSAERFRYRVSYQLIASWSLSINQSLSNGDYVRCGYYDGSNGWFMEHNGNHSSKEVDVVTLRDGVEMYRKTRELSTDLTNKSRIALQTAWYEVSRQKWRQSYGEGGQQKNFTFAEVADMSSDGSKSGNLPLRFEVNADANTTGLILEAGSSAILTQGNVGEISRSKDNYHSVSLDTSGSWVPLIAYKVKTADKNVRNQLRQLSTLSFGGSDTIELIALSFSSQNVTFAGTDSWDTPSSWSSNNTSLEYRTDVDNIVDSTGTSVANAADPGGILLGKSVLTSADKSSKAPPVKEDSKITSIIPENDYLVILAKSGVTGTIELTADFLMDY